MFSFNQIYLHQIERFYISWLSLMHGVSLVIIRYCIGYQCIKATLITRKSGSFGWAVWDSQKSASFSSKRVQSIFSPKVHLQFHKSNRFRRNQNAISILIICIPTMDNLISCKVGKPRPSFPRFYVFSNPALHFTQLLLLDNTTGRAGAATCILNSF